MGNAAVTAELELPESMARALQMDFMNNVTIRRVAEPNPVMRGFHAQDLGYDRNTPWKIEICQWKKSAESDTFVLHLQISVENLVLEDQFEAQVVLEVGDSLFEMPAFEWFVVKECTNADTCQTCPQLPHCIAPDQIEHVADAIREVNSTVHEIEDYLKSEEFMQYVAEGIQNQTVDAIEERLADKIIKEIINTSSALLMQGEFDRLSTHNDTNTHDIISIKTVLIINIVFFIIVLIGLVALIFKEKIYDCLKRRFPSHYSHSQEVQTDGTPDGEIPLRQVTCSTGMKDDQHEMENVNETSKLTGAADLHVHQPRRRIPSDKT